ncbi:MAG: hypothetical protein ABIM89_08735, partial [Mycobacteriales bacterium]
VSIVGISFVAIVGGMYTTMVASDANRKQANAATYLTSYAEAVKGDLDVNCATAANYPGSAFSLPSGYTKSLVVEYWNGTSFAATCGTDTGLQRISLTVRSADSRAILDVQLAKRKP